MKLGVVKRNLNKMIIFTLHTSVPKMGTVGLSGSMCTFFNPFSI